MTLPVLHSLVDPRALEREVPGAWPLPGRPACRVLHQGFGDVYSVRSDSGSWILRLTRHGRRTRDEVEGEVRILEVLAAAGLSVARPVRTSSGEALLPVAAPEGERWAVLFEAAPGNVPLEVEPVHGFVLGAFLGSMHRTLDALAAPVARPTLDLHGLFERPLATIRAAFPDHPAEIEALEDLTGRVRAGLEGLETGSPAFGLCHGDLIQTNVHAAPGRLTVFDFDHCVRTWRAYDLAVFLWSLPAASRAEVGEAFLHGYREKGPVGLDAIEPLLPRFEFARELLVWSWHVEAATDFRAVNPNRLRHELERLGELARAGSKRVSLKAVVEALDLGMEELRTFVHAASGRVETVRQEALAEAEEMEPDEPIDDEEIQVAAEILDGAWVELPDRREIGEYRMMEDFIAALSDARQAERLSRAIEGRGAFRRFKDEAARLGLLERWYACRGEAYEAFARRWLEDEGIAYVDDV